MKAPLLSVHNLKVHFPIKGGILLHQVANVHAVNDVSFNVTEGETLGLVGESGCGKSTVARTVLGLYAATAGKVYFEGQDIAAIDKKELRKLRRKMQIIFQDPAESLNARHTIGTILGEPFIIHGVGTPRERRQWVEALLHKVGLPSDAVSRFPHEFSGGQRQRIGIARAIALSPKLLICDEPVSALDVSVRSQILNLLMQLQQELNLTLIFIAHDLAVVKHISDRVAVMYLGRIVEKATSDRLYRRPLHPYTQSLIQAIPVPDPGQRKKMAGIEGDVPSPINPPPGCHFHTRCPYARSRCQSEVPLLRAADDRSAHLFACHFAEDIERSIRSSTR